MKALTFLLIVTCTGLAAAAQESNKSSSPDSNARSQVSADLTYPPRTDPGSASSERENTTCYTVRAYLFERSQTGTPEPAGMITCVPADRRELKRIREELKRSRKRPAPSVPGAY
jgi:hypothetical protein